LWLERDAAGGDFCRAHRLRLVKKAQRLAWRQATLRAAQSFAAASCGAESRAELAGAPLRLFPGPPLESATWCAAGLAVV
jgi:hypothetical protein